MKWPFFWMEFGMAQRYFSAAISGVCVCVCLHCLSVLWSLKHLLTMFYISDELIDAPAASEQSTSGTSERRSEGRFYLFQKIAYLQVSVFWCVFFLLQACVYCKYLSIYSPWYWCCLFEEEEGKQARYLSRYVISPTSLCVCETWQKPQLSSSIKSLHCLSVLWSLRHYMFYFRRADWPTSTSQWAVDLWNFQPEKA